MWHYTSHTHPPHAQSQQNHSRLLWVLLSSGQEPLHQEGFSISGDRVWVWSRGPLRLYSASLAPHFSPRTRQRADTTGCSLPLPEPKHTWHKPSFYTGTTYKELWVVSNKLGNNSDLPGTPVLSLWKVRLQDSMHSLPWEGPSKGRVTFSLVMTSGEKNLSICHMHWSLLTKPDLESKRQHFSFIKPVTSEVIISSSYFDARTLS